MGKFGSGKNLSNLVNKKLFAKFSPANYLALLQSIHATYSSILNFHPPIGSN